MEQKTFNLTVGVIFLIIGVLHLLRIIYGWPASIDTFAVPLWFSWVGVLLAGFLSYSGLKRKG